jgi:hypothetical protein
MNGHATAPIKAPAVAAARENPDMPQNGTRVLAAAQDRRFSQKAIQFAHLLPASFFAALILAMRRFTVIRLHFKAVAAFS